MARPQKKQINQKTFRQKASDAIRHNFITRFPYRRTYQNTTIFLKKRPFISFFIALAALLLLIILGNIFGQAKPEQPKVQTAKAVKTYNIGTAPKITFQGKVQKSGVIKIMAQAGGIVQNISLKEGDQVYRGTQILSLSSNYQGGNAAALQAQLARKQYQNVKDTYDQQVDLLNKQRDVARKTQENSAEMQNINAQAATESASLINSNQDYLNNLNQGLQTLQAQYQANPNPLSPTGVAQQQSIQQLQGTVLQLQAGLNQLKQGQRQLAYQAEGTNPPAELATLQRDITLGQLDIQQKALELSKETTRLQSQIAEVNASSMYPASPVAGTIQRIHVREGQAVAPGTLLATIAASEQSTSIIVNVPQHVAQNISQLEASDLTIGTHIYSVRPTFVSSEATDGQLYSIIYNIPEEDNALVTDASYIRVEIPVGASNTGAAVPFIPIDAVYQTQEQSYLLVERNGKAESREVSLGQVFGSFVEIAKGLKSGDRVILDRNIVAGDKVTIQ